MSTTTPGSLLNGRVLYTQLSGGFRSGIEPVMLAASIGARAGQRVLEGGTGAGATLLCLAARVPGLEGVGIEIDPAQVDRARANAVANEMADLSFIAGDIEAVAPDGQFDHACANPPYHLAAGTQSPDTARNRAKQASEALLTVWAVALGRVLRHRGTLTFVLPAAHIPACIVAMEKAMCPVEAVLPLWPKQGVAAKLTIVRGMRNGRGPMRLLPGIVLHEADGRFTPAADAILRGGGRLNLDY
ncbi:MAG: methyltransferase [Rhodospirillales bacterium]